MISMTMPVIRSERVTRAAVVVPQKNQVSSDELIVTIPPRVTVGSFVNAALQQKSALEAALRLWDVSYGGRDPTSPRAFNPMMMQGKFGSFKVVFEEEEGAEHAFVMEMTSRWVVMEMDMAYPADSLRQFAQKYDSDHRPKEFGAVVGGNTLVTAEEMRVVLGPFPDEPMMDTKDFKVEGLMVFASREPDPAKCITALIPLNATLKEGTDGHQGLFVLRQRKDGMPLKLFGDVTIQVSDV